MSECMLYTLSLEVYMRNVCYNLVNKTNLVNNFFVCLFLFSTCFGQLCAHHQKKVLYQCDTWYLSLCVDDRLLCRMGYQTVIHRVTNTRCRIDTVISPDDGHLVARNM
jgi:hypothetical protein